MLLYRYTRSINNNSRCVYILAICIRHSLVYPRQLRQNYPVHCSNNDFLSSAVAGPTYI